ncbi:hypothetical protein SmJEL517_g05775 [Synchytrium microbalum]|uniref:Tubby C-terminal domain-containing protein n=1 Tax=Synchytrium microbalum TaxID=1806994 RepID=A0A507BU16_9FUNG|nr:uncharacterized protein SmJEL517_g05775 [Synchytrium microbalum]TPX30731.1 hypothetical protein SmJEL517_g05775 [Synchytrium microbalum]
MEGSSHISKPLTRRNAIQMWQSPTQDDTFWDFGDDPGSSSTTLNDHSMHTLNHKLSGIGSDGGDSLDSSDEEYLLTPGTGPYHDAASTYNNDWLNDRNSSPYPHSLLRTRQMEPRTPAPTPVDGMHHAAADNMDDIVDMGVAINGNNINHNNTPPPPTHHHNYNHRPTLPPNLIDVVHPLTHFLRTHPSLSTTAIIDILTKPLPQGQKLLCKIIRHKEGVEKLYPSYEVFIEDPADTSKTFLMAARKRKKSRTSNYIITSTRLPVGNKKEKDAKDYKRDVIGKVRSNFLGTAFAIYDNGRNPMPNGLAGNAVGPIQRQKMLREELGSVIYDPNILGFKGPRKMTVLLPGMTRNGNRIPLRPTQSKDTLLEQYKSKNEREMLVLHNKSPQWNEETQSYVLNFNGRVTLASVKNFQIVHDNDLDYVILQFGRISENEFTMDFQYPLSAIQAFGIAITSFDAKLACE